MKIGLTYDDVLLVPQYSDIRSRSLVSIETDLGKEIKLNVPIIASPMDTVSEEDMSYGLANMGGISVIHG